MGGMSDMNLHFCHASIECSYKRRRGKSSNSYYEVVRDAYYKNGFIYLLTSSFEGKYKCNTIIVLKKNADNIQYVSAYTLKNNLYSTFCINDQNECLAVCSKNSSIEVYKLPKVILFFFM